MPRSPRLLLTVALAICAAPMTSVALGKSVALADDEAELAIGTELQATSDVTLHQAEISKGSRVNVTKLLVRAGRVDGVSVALADGHIVKMTLGQVHTFFRVVHD